MRTVVAALFLLLSLSALAEPKPVVRKMSFNMFMLKPKNSNASAEPEYEKRPVKVLLSTNGVSRFPPILEYIVQRIQGIFSVHSSENYVTAAPMVGESENLTPASDYGEVNETPDESENEVQHHEDHVGLIHGVDGPSGLPNVVVKPSSVHPGTYEVEISVAVDDDKTNDSTAVH